MAYQQHKFHVQTGHGSSRMSGINLLVTSSLCGRTFASPLLSAVHCLWWLQVAGKCTLLLRGLNMMACVAGATY
jgi:hypothetical protein